MKKDLRNVGWYARRAELSIKTGIPQAAGVVREAETAAF